MSNAATKPNKIRGPRWLRVSFPRNSVCGSERLINLNFYDWWTEAHTRYIHVAGPDGTRHRVFCRASDTPRLASVDNVLYWLVDRTEAPTSSPRAQRK